MGIKVEVKEGKFEKSFRTFKKKVDEDGLLKELRSRDSYVKPSLKRKLAKNAAKKRWQKYLNSNKLPNRKF